jgi:hypothetical protein
MKSSPTVRFTLLHDVVHADCVCQWRTWVKRRTLKPPAQKRSKSAPKNSFSTSAALSDREACLTSIAQDLREEFVKELIYPAVQANAIYEVSHCVDPSEAYAGM